MQSPRKAVRLGRCSTCLSDKVLLTGAHALRSTVCPAECQEGAKIVPEIMEKAAETRLGTKSKLSTEAFSFVRTRDGDWALGRASKRVPAYTRTQPDDCNSKPNSARQKHLPVPISVLFVPPQPSSQAKEKGARS